MMSSEEDVGSGDQDSELNVSLLGKRPTDIAPADDFGGYMSERSLTQIVEQDSHESKKMRPGPSLARMLQRL